MGSLADLSSCSLSETALLPYVCVGAVLSFLCAVGIGANDLAANFAMVVGSGSLSLNSAIKYCAFFEVLGAALMGGKVTATITAGIFDNSLIERDASVAIAGMTAASFAATSWLFLSSYFGLPVSITHTVVGSMLGFAIFAGGGFAHVKVVSVVQIIASWVIAPVGAAIVTMLLLRAVNTLLLRRGTFLERLRRTDEDLRAAEGEARYLPVPNRTPRGSARPTTSFHERAAQERRRQHSFGGSAVSELFRYMPALVFATLAVNGAFVLIEQPEMIQSISFPVQVVVVIVVVCATTYAITAAWLPSVREAALSHRGPFPWQFEALRLSRVKARPVVATTGDGEEEASPLSGSRRRRRRTAGANLGDDFSLGAAATSGSVEADAQDRVRVPLVPLAVESEMSDASGLDSEDSSASSIYDPETIARSVSFSANSMAPGVRKRRTTKPRRASSRNTVDEEDSTASTESDGASHGAPGAAATAAPFRAPKRSQATTLVPVVTRRHQPSSVSASPLDGAAGKSGGGSGRSPLSMTAYAAIVGGSPNDVSQRAEYLFTALQLIAGAMSSFVHGAVAGANATGPFIVLYSVYVHRMMALKIQAAAAGGGAHGSAARAAAMSDAAASMHRAADAERAFDAEFATFLAMAGIAVGMAVLGARIVLTVGAKLVVVTPAKGYAMQIGGTVVTMLCTAVGMPVSLSQCQVGAAVGSGLFERMSGKKEGGGSEGAATSDAKEGGGATGTDGVNWALVLKLMAGWVLTILVSAATSGIALHVIMFAMCRHSA